MSNESYKNVTVQIEPSLLEKIDQRANEMDLNRSQYLRRLMKRDLNLTTPEIKVQQPQDVAD